MSKSVNQHWVPQFYLKEFATPETRNTDRPQVWIFSKRDGDPYERLTNIRNVCAKRYLYSPPTENGDRSWDIDDKLQSVESLLSKLWSHVSSDFVDLSDPSIRESLSLFIATNHIRHPDNLDVAKSVHQELVAGLDHLPKKSDGTPNIVRFINTGEEFEVDTSNWHDYRHWTEDDHRRFFAQLIRWEAGHLARLLLAKRWSVVLAEDSLFITSDRPVSLQHESRETFGVETPGTVISFPLSPTRMLIIDDRLEEPANQYHSLKPGSVGAFNLNTWRDSARFMITGRAVSDVLSEMLDWAEFKGYA